MKSGAQKARAPVTKATHVKPADERTKLLLQNNNNNKQLVYYVPENMCESYSNDFRNEEVHLWEI